jgi:hypothetical protein
MFPKCFKGLTLGAEVHYLPSVTGSKGHNAYYFVTSAELALWNNKETNQQIGLKISYEDGSLDFTKQNVDDFKLSLAVSF